MAETTNKQSSDKEEEEEEEEEEDYMGDLSQFLPRETTAPSKSSVKMGYTPGSTLGKEGSGLAEPVGLEIRWTRAGIGREDSRKEKRKREEERMKWERRKEKVLMKDFGCRHKEQWWSQRIVVNYHKAKAALEQLENKEVVAEADKDEEDAKNE
ncbi:G patch domain-containing protein 11 [Camellia lanceoleosa]|uniref:G patch domain-containing protein 11 n=1 Tax=Camellia lanceoleosa TaxID=1840588 RepID=A0ACC0FRQ5_9ERIC|nr:G patch domain-containing protein 11 [Camellia lanceoleosa]